MVSGFENDTATFLTHEQTGTEEGPYGDSEPVYEWVESYADVSVRSEQQDAEYVSEVYGEWPQEVYRLYIDPHKIGDVTESGYELGVEADDRVSLGVTDGQFNLQPPKYQSVDSEIPDHIEIEVTRVSD